MIIYDYTMHKITFYNNINRVYEVIISYKVSNRKNRDVISRTRYRFILRATMAESDSASDSSTIRDESDASTSTSF